MDKIRLFLERWWIVLVLLISLPFFYSAAVSNEQSTDYVNNGFFTFWLSGQMNWTDAHPYSSEDWVAGHHANGAVWIPNQIFPYPLPLALFMAPLGLFPIKEAYILWNLISQVIIAVSILWLATFWEGFNRRVFGAVILVAVMFNSNVHLMLLTGTISALFLVFLVLALYFVRQRLHFAAGIALSLLALKPPFLMIIALIGLWFLFRRNWRAVGGMFIGGLGLLGIGTLQDLHWVEKFRGASENLFNMRLGNQPTIISYTRLACSGDLVCALEIYLLLALVLVGLYIWLVWKKRDSLTPLAAFSLAIALGVLLPPYIWSYDYVLLIIPVCYICFELVRRKASYLYATLFLLLLDALSVGMATLFGMNPESDLLTIQRDMWSILVGILVLLVTCGIVFSALMEQTDNNLTGEA